MSIDKLPPLSNRLGSWLSQRENQLSGALDRIVALEANLVHRDELYEAALVKIREYEDHILTLGSQLAELKRQEKKLGR